jgi:hypothetical protein
MLCGQPAPERLTLATEWPRLNEGGLEQIKEWIASKENPKLIVIDHLKRIRPDEHGNNARLYNLDYDSVACLADLAHDTSTTILVVHHTRKAQADDHIDLASGSLGLTGAVDSVLTMKRSRGQSDATLSISGRDCEDTELALRWDNELTQWNLLGKADGYNKSKSRREVIDLLRKSDKPLPPREVANLLPKNYEATKKLLWTMDRDNELQNIDGRYQVKQFGNNGDLVIPGDEQSLQRYIRRVSTVA